MAVLRDKATTCASSWLDQLEPHVGLLLRCDETGELLRMARERVVNLIIVVESHISIQPETLYDVLREGGLDVPVVVLSDQERPYLSPNQIAGGACWALSARLDLVAVLPVIKTLITRSEQARLDRATAKSLQSELVVLHKVMHEHDLRRKELVHELNTPIAVIQGFGSNLLVGLEGELTGGQRQGLERIQAACELLVQLVAQVRTQIDDSRGQPPRGKEARTTQRRQLRIADLVNQIASLLVPRFRDKGVDLQLELDPGCPPIWGEWTRISQLLVNLLNNALRHTPPGGWVKVATQARTPRSGADPGEGPAAAKKRTERPGCRLVVQDCGSGIPVDKQDAIFTPGWSSVPEGTERAGLGLAICKEVASEHNANIWVESAPGEGAAFHVDLPADPRQRARRVALDLVDDSVLAGQLIVELQQKCAGPMQVVRHSSMERLANQLWTSQGSLVLIGPLEPGLEQALLLAQAPDEARSKQRREHEH